LSKTFSLTVSVSLRYFLSSRFRNQAFHQQFPDRFFRKNLIYIQLNQEAGPALPIPPEFEKSPVRFPELTGLGSRPLKKALANRCRPDQCRDLPLLLTLLKPMKRSKYSCRTSADNINKLPPSTRKVNGS
jgi:hypothetical protein